MLVDAHCHLDPELRAPELIAAMDRGGVDAAVLIAAAQAPIGPIPRAGVRLFTGCMHVPLVRMKLYAIARRSRTLRPHLRPDNDGVFDAASRNRRFIPFAFVNPMLGAESHDELDHRISQGARGVKLHAWLHDFRLPQAMSILKRCEQHDLPVLVHLGFGPASDVAAVLEECPTLRLIVAHAGIPHFGALWKLDRVLFDTAATGQLISQRMVRRLVDAVGRDRVVFGSDAPIGLRARSGHEYRPPPLPDAAMGANLLRVLE
ncbi:MAG: amidohydrolase family protein [Actinomycetota bacterium]